jgi:hypothetical protein
MFKHPKQLEGTVFKGFKQFRDSEEIEKYNLALNYE